MGELKLHMILSVFICPSTRREGMHKGPHRGYHWQRNQVIYISLYILKILYSESVFTQEVYKVNRLKKKNFRKDSPTGIANQISDTWNITLLENNFSTNIYQVPHS